MLKKKFKIKLNKTTIPNLPPEKAKQLKRKFIYFFFIFSSLEVGSSGSHLATMGLMKPLAWGSTLTCVLTIPVWDLSIQAFALALNRSLRLWMIGLVPR